MVRWQNLALQGQMVLHCMFAGTSIEIYSDDLSEEPHSTPYLISNSDSRKHCHYYPSVLCPDLPGQMYQQPLVHSFEPCDSHVVSDALCVWAFLCMETWWGRVGQRGRGEKELAQAIGLVWALQIQLLSWGGATIWDSQGAEPGGQWQIQTHYTLRSTRCNWCSNYHTCVYIYSISGPSNYPESNV